MARIRIVLDPPRPKRVPMVDGRPVTRRPKLGLGLTLTKPDPVTIAAKNHALEIMLADAFAGRHTHPLTRKHIRLCVSCRKRKRALYRQALRRMTS